MGFVLIIMLVGDVQMKNFSSERTCIAAGQRIENVWVKMNDKEKAPIAWSCVRA